MFNLLKKKSSKQVENIFLGWHHACHLLLDDKTSRLMNYPRPRTAACLFFMGSIDYLCKNFKISDKEWLVLNDKLLGEIGYPPKLSASLIMSFYFKYTRPEFALHANLEGGKRIKEFIRGENKMAPWAFGSLLREHSSRLEFLDSDLCLFGYDELGNPI